jgi:predicted Zn-dependent peptidase
MRLYSYVLLLLFCCSGHTLWSQEQVATAVKFTDFKLENGLRVIVLNDTTLQGFSANLLVDYPLVLEGELKGVSTLVGQLLGTGTKLHNKTEIDSLLDLSSCTINAMGQQLQLQGSLEKREAILSLLAEIVQQATFPEEEVERLKAALKRITEATDTSVTTSSNHLSNQLVFGADHPYGERVSIENLVNISSETCQQFYKKYYRPIVSYLVLTGNLQAKEARFLVEKYFGNWRVQGAMFAAFYNPAPLPLKTRLSFVNIPAAPAVGLEIGYSIPLRPGSEDELKVALLKQVLDEKLVRASWNPLGNIVSAVADPYVGVFRVSPSILPPELVEQAIDDILATLSNLRNQLVDQQALVAAKANLTSQYIMYHDLLMHKEGRAGKALSIVRFKLPRNYYDNYLQRLNEITAADLLEVAREYLLPGRAHIVVAGDQAIAPSLTRFAGDGKVHYYTKEGKEIESMDLELATESITAEQVVEKYLVATGGRARLTAVNDLWLEAEAKLHTETMVMTRVKKNNEMFLEQFRIGNLNILKIIFDGQVARVIQGNRQEEVTEEDVEKFRADAVIFPELKYQDQGYQLKVAGSAVLNNQNVHILDVITPSGKSSSQYFDSSNGFLVRSVTEENAKMLIWDYSDYRAVEGVKLPHQLVLTGLLEEPLLFRVKSLKLNQAITEDLFKIED